MDAYRLDRRVMTLTADRLRELFHYDKDTGVFTRLVNCSNVRAGAVAGCLKNDGYLCIRVDGRLYSAHRLAWFYMTGEWPGLHIDHANSDRSDNRWANLREATYSQNNANSIVRKDNKSGFKGASRSGKRLGWQACIRWEGRSKHLGYFDSPEAAHAAYLAAANELFGEFARAA